MSKLMFLAVLPGILIIIYIFKRDKVEKEPINLIIKMIILGAVSCIPAAFLESFIEGYLPYYPIGSLEYALTISFLSAGLMEEGSKYFFLKIGIWKNREFNYRFDGVVYGVAVAVGFAMLENILYVMDGGMSVAITRAFLAVPLHAFCGAFMGGFFGMAKFNAVRGNREKCRSNKVGAVLLPIAIHGTYDTFAFLEWDYAVYGLLAFVALLYILGICFINRLSKDDWKMSFYQQSEEDIEFVPSYNRPTTVKATNGFSIAGLVLGIISFITFTVLWIPSILAIIFSAIGLKKTPVEASNTVAKTGMVLGVISLVICFAIYYFMFG